MEPIGVIIAILLCALIGAIIYNAHCRKLQVFKINQDILTQNQHARAESHRLEEECLQKKEELEGYNLNLADMKQELTEVEDKLERQTIQLSQLSNALETTSQEYQKTAEERAQKTYEACMKALQSEYAAVVNDLQDGTRKEIADYQLIQKAYLATQSAIEDLQAKQLAYIQMKQREEEMQNMIDYYRLLLSEEDQQDVKFLREVQIRLVHKEAIDKIIWDGYYKPAFDILASHIFSCVNEKKCGIYRITCLTTEKSYIGQSVDIRDRWKQHIKTALAYTSTSNKLYQEMKKQGIENFMFEIVEEVPRAQLNEREVYWIDFYKTRDWGLNSTKGGS